MGWSGNREKGLAVLKGQPVLSYHPSGFITQRLKTEVLRSPIFTLHFIKFDWLFTNQFHQFGEIVLQHGNL